MALDTTKLEDGLAPILAFYIQNNKTETDDVILERLTNALKKVQEQGAVTPKQVVDGIGKTLDFITDVIPGDWDDTFVDGAYNMSRISWEKKFSDKLESFGKKG